MGDKKQTGESEERMTEADAAKSLTHKRPEPDTAPPSERPEPKASSPQESQAQGANSQD